MDVKETFGEDNSSYFRKSMSFTVRSISDPEGGLILGASAYPGQNEDKCLVTRVHLKRVGVSVLSLAECPLVAADVNVAISAFESDDCISFIERDTIVRLYPTIEGPAIPDTKAGRGIHLRQVRKGPDCASSAKRSS